MKKKPTLCPTCKKYHPIHEDGFEYLDCMLFFKKHNLIKSKKINS